MFLVRNGGGLDSGDAVALIAGGGLVHRVQVASGDRVRGGERGKPMVGWGGLGPGSGWFAPVSPCFPRMEPVGGGKLSCPFAGCDNAIEPGSCIF